LIREVLGARHRMPRRGRDQKKPKAQNSFKIGILGAIRAYTVQSHIFELVGIIKYYVTHDVPDKVAGLLYAYLQVYIL
jgi:hypothetical protein